MIHPYQAAGAKFLRSKRYAMLADSMGLGKTLQAILAAEGLAPILVVCPAVARVGWEREFVRWGSRASMVVEKLTDAAYPEGVTIASYDYVRVNYEKLSLIPWATIILDEAQNVKGLAAQRTAALFGANGIARNPATRVWWLTGTPLENAPHELWLPLFFSGNTELSYQNWVTTFCTGYMTCGRFTITGARKDSIPVLRKLLLSSGFMLRRLKADVLPQLPALTIERLDLAGELPTRVEMAGAFPEYFALGQDRIADLQTKIKLEEELLRHALSDSNRLTREGLALLQGLAGSVATLRRYVGMQLVAPVAEILASELESGALEKVLVIYKHNAVGDALARRLARFGVRVISGRNANARQASVDAFNQDPKVRVCVGQIKACGTALTLHADGACSSVLAIETEWDPSSLVQALNRVHRIGQPNAVHARIAVLDDPLARAVIGIIERKAQEIAELLDGRRERVFTAAWLMSEG